MKLSEYFPVPRSGSGTPRKAAASKRSRKPTSPTTPLPTENNGMSGAKGDTARDGDSYVVTLRGGGTITITVAESHFNLSKNRTDREFVNGLVDAMVEYAVAHDEDVVLDEGVSN